MSTEKAISEDFTTADNFLKRRLEELYKVKQRKETAYRTIDCVMNDENCLFNASIHMMKQLNTTDIKTAIETTIAELQKAKEKIKKEANEIFLEIEAAEKRLGKKND